jgi:hypothetical protein
MEKENDGYAYGYKFSRSCARSTPCMHMRDLCNDGQYVYIRVLSYWQLVFL